MTVLIAGRLCRGSAVVSSATRTPVPLVTQDVLRNQGTCLPILSDATAQVRLGQPHPVSLAGLLPWTVNIQRPNHPDFEAIPDKEGRSFIPI
jgi:hypothetical protein